MSTFSGVAWLLLCACTGVTAGHVSTTTTPGLYAGKPVMEKLDRLEQLLKSPQQTPQCPCSVEGCEPSTERLGLKKKMSVLEAKLEAVETKLGAMERKLGATETKLGATEKKLGATERKLEAMETKLEATEIKVGATEKKLGATEKKLGVTARKLGATEKKLKTTERKLGATERKLGATERKLGAVEANQKATDRGLQSTKALLRARKGGSTFVRWGRKTCTSASELVYSGVGGGGHWTQSGAAANMLCLTMKPQSQSFSRPRHYTYLYGAEYEWIRNHHDHDVPCSVCRATQSTTIMIPATRSCPRGWTTQYTGYLVAGHHTHKAATEYLCLDRYPEDMPGGHQDRNGKLLYYTFAQCGSLPCPPYSNNAVVLCVVCSK